MSHSPIPYTTKVIVRMKTVRIRYRLLVRCAEPPSSPERSRLRRLRRDQARLGLPYLPGMLLPWPSRLRETITPINRTTMPVPRFEDGRLFPLYIRSDTKRVPGRRVYMT